MDKILLENINWDIIQSIKFSNGDIPNTVLGSHIWADRLCIVSYFPGAINVEAIFDDGMVITLDKIDIDIFACRTDFNYKLHYKLKVQYKDSIVIKEDPYSFDLVLPNADYLDFSIDICTNSYDFLGSHPKTIDGVDGVQFSVWAPMAKRVSVVGDFNLWDGRINQMTKVHPCGIFSIFIPDIKNGSLYKYEIRTIYDDIVLKSDPYSRRFELRPKTASIVYKDNFIWEDKDWITKQKKLNIYKSPMSVLEVHLGTFKKPNDDRDFYNYRELAHIITDHVKNVGYTHIELMPIMEHPYDGSWGYQVTGYYAPTSRYGSPEDFKYFINYLHKNNIGIILDWVPAHFPKDAHGLAKFDGTCLYEHANPLQAEHPDWGTLIFNYSRKEVQNFLLSNADFWASEYHIDGLRVDAVSSMLYLNFGKKDGQWIPNIHGGYENLDAIDFLKNFNKTLEKNHKNVIRIAEESTAWEGITHKNGLGFDFKWNMGWMNDYLRYIEYDPYFRSYHHNELTFSFSYTNAENYILAISHDEVVHLKKSLISKMPGDYKEKFSNLRLSLGFMMTHPGKKLLFMGQDIGEFDEWNEYRQLQWNLLDYDMHSKLLNYVKDLNNIYKTNKSLYYYDCRPEGFEWINGSYTNESLLIFMRKATRKSDLLVIALNFTPVVRKNFKIGVKYKGNYKEIFNSDDIKYGGNGNINKDIITSSKCDYDLKQYAINLTIPPLGISILRYEN